MNKITPLNGYVILKPIETQEETFGNIIIPDLGKERPEMGEVVDSSQVYNFHTDKHVESKLKPGQTVLIPKLDGAPVEEAMKFSVETNRKNYGKKETNSQSSFLSKLYK